ncbi:MAG: hypothetical protein ACOC31_01995 [Bacteroidota bacterium]
MPSRTGTIGDEKPEKSTNGQTFQHIINPYGTHILSFGKIKVAKARYGTNHSAD